MFSEANAKWRPPPIPKWACGIDSRAITGQFLSLLVVIAKSPKGGLEGCPQQHSSFTPAQVLLAPQVLALQHR